MKTAHTRILFAVSLLASFVSAGQNHSSKTYFSSINPFQIASPERTSMFHRDRQNMKECGWGTAIQAVPFYQKSNDSSDITEYFFPFGNTSLVAGEYRSTSVAARADDLLAHQFGVFTSPVSAGSSLIPAGLTYQSTLTMCPEESIGGVGLTWQQYLFCDLWFDISTSIVQVTHKLKFKEKAGDSAGGGDVTDDGFATMSAALSSTRLNYGRFQTGCDDSMKNSGLADIELRLAWDKELCGGCAGGGVYLGAVFPTGTRVGKTDDDCDSCTTSTLQQTSTGCKDWGRYIYQPVVGNGHHYGFMFGSYAETQLWCNDCDYTLTLYSDLNARYLFSNTQRRSFDLKDKEWGRYLSVWESDTVDADLAAVIDLKPLINYSTLCTKVTPGWSVDMNAAFMFSARCFDIEIGYNAFYREGEHIKCPKNFTSGLGLVAIADWIVDGGQLGGPTPTTASLETISYDNFANAQDADIDGTLQYVSIAATDLDLSSASAPCVLQGTVFGAVNYNLNNCCVPAFIGIGGSYSSTADNAAVNHWTIWGKVGIAF